MAVNFKCVCRFETNITNSCFSEDQMALTAERVFR